jgi:uncharacterized protein YdhG (YjbR/CyaY superfamily)
MSGLLFWKGETMMFEEYIQNTPATHQEYLWKVYQIIKEEFPEANEKFSYGMPAFYWKKNAVYFSDNKKHLGFYPMPSVVSTFKERLDELEIQYSKGAVKFPYNQPLNETLIREMVRYRKKELSE